MFKEELLPAADRNADSKHFLIGFTFWFPILDRFKNRVTFKPQLNRQKKTTCRNVDWNCKT